MTKRKILIVEDDEAIAKLIDINLKIAGYDTVICYDGISAINEIKTESTYDLTLLDIMLPGLNGFEVLEEMKKAKIPVIFLTARDDVESKVAGLKGGAEDYIVKPFENLELLVRIEKVLERNHKADTIIIVRDIVINTEERTVKKCGKDIHLKPMEYELLITLIKNKNIAISREKLLEMVWGYDYFGELHTVDVHIGQLRKKLELKDIIKTVSRVGYRFEAGSNDRK